MKRNIIKLAGAIFASIIFGITATAQNIHLMRTGDITHPDGTREYVIPTTSIVVDITVRKESVRTGPYARFAQRHFGTIAPLTDKDSYTITDAQIYWYDNNSAPAPQIPALAEAIPPIYTSHIESEGEFLKVRPDKVSSANKSVENAAKDAAQAIFDIRKRRAELISGDYAETVFGEGLRAAIERLDKMENDYLELFYGKHSVSYETVRYTIVPEDDRTVYVICRWSESAGLLPENNLTGQPVILDMKPQKMATVLYPPTLPTKKDKNAPPTDDYIVAENTLCRIVEGKRELAKQTIPIYQFGIKRSL